MYSSDKGVIPLEDLTPTTANPGLLRLSHSQIKHFIHSEPILLQGHRTHTSNETQCSHHMLRRRLISSFYKLISQKQEETLPNYTMQWDKELNTQIQTNDWHKIFKNIFHTSRSKNIHECYYKRIARWHYTPTRINRFFPSTPKTCWRCNQIVGTKGQRPHLVALPNDPRLLEKDSNPHTHNNGHQSLPGT
ncbi:Hypothetical predicted protein [Pelobates cultripes]|uniref:Uncharacterized protein n=1 Tax=Pelobates cultripes TaxID=61616 RepID=A0AAD1S1H5_PELCU|nr:Hypothetical predicted protein [Pelobates cultripes]